MIAKHVEAIQNVLQEKPQSRHRHIAYIRDLVKICAGNLSKNHLFFLVFLLQNGEIQVQEVCASPLLFNVQKSRK